MQAVVFCVRSLSLMPAAEATVTWMYSGLVTVTDCFLIDNSFVNQRAASAVQGFRAVSEPAATVLAASLLVIGAHAGRSENGDAHHTGQAGQGTVKRLI